MSAPVIGAARTHLTALLAQLTGQGQPLEGWTVQAFMPEQIVPPCLIISEGTPVLSFDDPDAVGQATATFELAVVTRSSNNPEGLAALDTAVDAIVAHLFTHVAVTVNSYSVLTAPDSRNYLAARMTAQIALTME